MPYRCFTGTHAEECGVSISLPALLRFYTFRLHNLQLQETSL